MVIFFLMILILFPGCNEDNSIKTYTLPKNKEIPPISIPEKESGDIAFSWDISKHWVEKEKSQMRLASYSVPFSGGTADLSITNFSGDGGGILANINRWRGQLNLKSQSLEETEKNVIIINSNLGEHKLYKIINNKNEQTAFLCSILQIEKNTVFIKLVASINGIKELEEEFKVFCSSFKYNDK